MSLKAIVGIRHTGSSVSRSGSLPNVLPKEDGDPGGSVPYPDSLGKERRSLRDPGIYDGLVKPCSLELLMWLVGQNCISM